MNPEAPKTHAAPQFSWGNAAAQTLSVLGSYYTNQQNIKANNRNVDRTIQANRELAEYSYSKDYEMWLKQNAYNSPSSQMKRLSEAGINPHMAYMKGTINNTTSGGLPQYRPPKEEYSHMPKIAGAQTLLEYANIRLLNAQSKNLEASAERQLTQTEGSALQNARTAIALDLDKWTKGDKITTSHLQRRLVEITHLRGYYGLDGADTTMKVFFESMLANPNMSEDKIRTILGAMTLGKEVKDLINKIGFGWLFTKKPK